MLAIYKILLDPSSPRQATRSFWSEEEAGLYERERMTPEQRIAAGDNEPLALKRRGRPAGSKDARPRKRRCFHRLSSALCSILHAKVANPLTATLSFSRSAGSHQQETRPIRSTSPTDPPFSSPYPSTLLLASCPSTRNRS